MKSPIYILFFLCAFCSVSLQAQNNCDDEAPYFYDQAEVIYDTATLHSYCLDMRPGYEPAYHPWEGCSSTSFHNPAWLVFALPYDSITFEIRISDCVKMDPWGSLDTGAQFSIYKLPNDIQYDPTNSDGTQPVSQMLLTSCEWVHMPHQDTIMFGLKTKAGQHYGLVSDGWQGDRCRVEIYMRRANEVMSGYPMEEQRLSYGDSAQFRVVGEHVYTSTQWQVLENGQFVDLQESPTFRGVDTDTLTIHSPIFKQEMLFRYALGDSLAYVSDTFTVRSNYEEVRKHESISIVDEGPTIFPNPFKFDFTVEYNRNLGALEYQVFDVTGRLHSEGDIVEPGSRLQFEDLAQGLYFMHFKAEGRSWVRRIVHKR